MRRIALFLVSLFLLTARAPAAPAAAPPDLRSLLAEVLRVLREQAATSGPGSYDRYRDQLDLEWEVEEAIDVAYEALDDGDVDAALEELEFLADVARDPRLVGSAGRRGAALQAEARRALAEISAELRDMGVAVPATRTTAPKAPATTTRTPATSTTPPRPTAPRAPTSSTAAAATARKKAADAARKKAAEAARKKATEARKKAAEAAREKSAEARKRAAAEAKAKAAAAAKAKAAADARARAAAQARAKAAADARAKAAAAAKAKAAADARAKAAAAAKARAARDARARAAAVAKARAAAQARAQAAAAARAKAAAAARARAAAAAQAKALADARAKAKAAADAKAKAVAAAKPTAPASTRPGSPKRPAGPAAPATSGALRDKLFQAWVRHQEAALARIEALEKAVRNPLDDVEVLAIHELADIAEGIDDGTWQAAAAKLPGGSRAPTTRSGFVASLPPYAPEVRLRAAQALLSLEEAGVDLTQEDLLGELEVEGLVEDLIPEDLVLPPAQEDRGPEIVTQPVASGTDLFGFGMGLPQ